jgi:ADP-glucose pyrophosphorylase
MTDQELGIFGEQMAQKFLLKNGYRIRKLNYRYLKYEIDIIAEKEETIVVVEVKTRQTAEIGEPWMAVTRKSSVKSLPVPIITSNQAISPTKCALISFQSFTTNFAPNWSISKMRFLHDFLPQRAQTIAESFFVKNRIKTR